MGGTLGGRTQSVHGLDTLCPVGQRRASMSCRIRCGHAAKGPHERSNSRGDPITVNERPTSWRRRQNKILDSPRSRIPISHCYPPVHPLQKCLRQTTVTRPASCAICKETTALEQASRKQKPGRTPWEGEREGLIRSPESATRFHRPEVYLTVELQVPTTCSLLHAQREFPLTKLRRSISLLLFCQLRLLL